MKKKVPQQKTERWKRFDMLLSEETAARLDAIVQLQRERYGTPINRSAVVRLLIHEEFMRGRA